jgi:hypothetical protein
MRKLAPHWRNKSGAAAHGSRLNTAFHAVAIAALTLVWCLPPAARAVELKQKTAQAFEQYVRVTEAAMEHEPPLGQPFLLLERRPEQQRTEISTQLRQGQIYLERLQTRDAGKKIEIPDGLVHHWVGIVFIPNATLQRVLSVIQDYDNHQNIYRPYVRRSKLLHREGDDFKFSLQFYRKAIVTVVLNADFQAHYEQTYSTRAQARSYSTRIAEVENPGQADEREKPADESRGFLWRLNTYSRLEERDGGVYFQLETIALTRRVPFALRWLINPFVERIPKESLSLLLNATRKAVVPGT